MSTIVVNPHSSGKLLDGATSTGVGTARRFGRALRAVHGTVTGTGAVSATIDVYGSASDTAPTATTALPLVATITLSGTTTDGDGAQLENSWRWLIADLSAVSGTGATVNCWVS